QVNYMAREGGFDFRKTAEANVADALNKVADELSSQETGMFRAFSMKAHFPNQLHEILQPVAGENYQEANLELKEEHFPYFLKGRSLSLVSGENVSVVIQKKDGTVTLDSSLAFGPQSTFDVASPPSVVVQAGGDSQPFQMPYAAVNASGDVIDTWKLRFLPQLQSLSTVLNSTTVADIYFIINYRIEGSGSQPVFNPLF
ncbi:MAG: hypothetical protein AAFO69_20735, partial [Bacteroidota bacterium]